MRRCYIIDKKKEEEYAQHAAVPGMSKCLGETCRLLETPTRSSSSSSSETTSDEVDQANELRKSLEATYMNSL